MSSTDITALAADRIVREILTGIAVRSRAAGHGERVEESYK